MTRSRYTAIALLVIVALFPPIFLETGCAPQPQTTNNAKEKLAFEVSDTSSKSSRVTEGPVDGYSATDTQFDSKASTAAQSKVSADNDTATEPNNNPSDSNLIISQKLTSAVDDAAAYADDSGILVGMAIVDLNSGLRNGYQADEQMISASMIKLIIAYAFLEQVESGTYSLDEYYTLQASDIVGGTGTLGSLGAGAQISYREILEKMISVSDNTATNIIIDAIGFDSVNDAARKLELTDTKLNRRMMDMNGLENYTSANDVATLLEMAYEGIFINDDFSSLIMKALEEQQDYAGILGGLPAGTRFAHKTGTLGSVRHDGGIVETGRPFVLVTLCGGSGFYESGALNVMAQIAESAYAAENSIDDMGKN